MFVQGKALDEDRIAELIDIAREKKELSDLSREFIQEQLFKYLQKERKAALYLAREKMSTRAKEYKSIVKGLRARLRRFHGLFTETKAVADRSALFEKLEKAKTKKEFEEITEKILETHASSRERVPFYKNLYRDIFKVTKKPVSILDLGAGLNPLSLIHMDLVETKEKKEYYAYDINEAESQQLNLFFHKMSEFYPLFKGKAGVFDLLHWKLLEEMPDFDIAFLFKVTDILDQGKGHKVTEEVIIRIPAKWVVLSFPTLTISGKRMVAPRRKWVELMCTRLAYDFKVIKKENEIFYLIKKE